MNVIQFAKLEDMVKDLHGCDCARIQSVQHTESQDTTGMVRLAVFAVIIRAINEQGHILACFVPAFKAQLFRSVDEGKEINGWEKANHLESKIREYLDESGIDVRPGVIGLGSEKPLYGSFSYGDGDNESNS